MGGVEPRAHAEGTSVQPRQTIRGIVSRPTRYPLASRSEVSFSNMFGGVPVGEMTSSSGQRLRIHFKFHFDFGGFWLKRPGTNTALTVQTKVLR